MCVCVCVVMVDGDDGVFLMCGCEIHTSHASVEALGDK